MNMKIFNFFILYGLITLTLPTLTMENPFDFPPTAEENRSQENLPTSSTNPVAIILHEATQHSSIPSRPKALPKVPNNSPEDTTPIKKNIPQIPIITAPTTEQSPITKKNELDNTPATYTVIAENKNNPAQFLKEISPLTPTSKIEAILNNPNISPENKDFFTQIKEDEKQDKTISTSIAYLAQLDLNETTQLEEHTEILNQGFALLEKLNAQLNNDVPVAQTEETFNSDQPNPIAELTKETVTEATSRFALPSSNVVNNDQPIEPTKTTEQKQSIDNTLNDLDKVVEQTEMVDNTVKAIKQTETIDDILHDLDKAIEQKTIENPQSKNSDETTTKTEAITPVEQTNTPTIKIIEPTVTQIETDTQKDQDPSTPEEKKQTSVPTLNLEPLDGSPTSSTLDQLTARMEKTPKKRLTEETNFIISVVDLPNENAEIYKNYTLVMIDDTTYHLIDCYDGQSMILDGDMGQKISALSKKINTRLVEFYLQLKDADGLYAVQITAITDQKGNKKSLLKPSLAIKALGNLFKPQKPNGSIDQDSPESTEKPAQSWYTPRAAFKATLVCTGLAATIIAILYKLNYLPDNCTDYINQLLHKHFAG